MATFKEGDKVICIKDNFADILTGKEWTTDPKKGDKFIIVDISTYMNRTFLEFEEIPPTGDEKHWYTSKAFRKLKHDFTNHETAELVKDFQKEEFKQKELQEDELKIFTTGADF